jgi:hypothetical protein
VDEVEGCRVRIRSIKPEFWSSDDITALHWYERLLLIGLWSYVDDNGVGRDRLASIAGDLFSGDVERDPAATFQRITEGLVQLEAKGRIVRYEVDGTKYLAITGWHHQRIDKPAKARYPRPEDSRPPRGAVATASRDSRDGSSTPTAAPAHASAALATSERATEPSSATHEATFSENVPLTGHSSETRDTLATPSRDSRDTLAPGTEEQGNRGTGESSSSDVADATPDDNSDDFQAPQDAQLLADLLLSLMAKNGESPRPAKPTKAWLVAADRLLRIDGRDAATAMGLLRWAKQDDFWAANIKSIPTFREKYDQLTADAKRKTGARSGRTRLAAQIRAGQNGGAR